MALRLPPAAELPLEHAVTKPAPPPVQAGPTLRATPAAGQAPIRIESTPAGQPGGSLPPPSADPQGAQVEALRRRAEQAEAKLVEKPRISISEAPISDEALGKFVRVLTVRALKRWGIPLAVLSAAGGAGVALQQGHQTPAPAPPPPVTSAQLEAVLKKARDSEAKTNNRLARLAKCVLRQQDKMGKMLLPAPDHVGSALKIEPFENKCLELAEQVKVQDQGDEEP